MYRVPENGIVIGPYGGIGYFERGDRKAVVTSFRWRRLLKYLCSLL